MPIDGLAATLLAFLVVTVAPGPANIAVSSISIAHGRAAGMRFGAGLALGLALWGLVAATGLGTLLAASVWGLTVLKICGGLYLLWLALQSARSAVSNRPEAPDVRPCERLFIRGLFLNLSNPKAVVAWMAALSVGFARDDSITTLMIATGLCIAIGVANYAGHAALFSTSQMMLVYARARRWVEAGVAALFAMAGLGLLRSAALRGAATS